MAGTQAAVTEATRLGEIGFPEFTAKLITDTFDALMAANMKQTEAYIELVKEISKSLTEFINSAKDDISGEMVLQFLTKVLPNTENTGTALQEGGTVPENKLTDFNNAIKVEGDDNGKVVTATTPYADILQAIARRIAADKYTLLQDMVKLGLLRIVVEEGEIETRLTFNTFGSTYYQGNSSQYNSSQYNLKASAKTGGFLSRWVKASASADYSSVSVSTANATNRDTSGSSVQIYGSVKLKFKTDYQPLNK